MPSITSKKLAYTTAVQFKESFYEPNPEVGYVFIGNHLNYLNESSPPSISDNVFDEKATWDNMYAAKKITGTDVELVIPRNNWEPNKKYKQYDDLAALENLIEPNLPAGVEPFYIITSERNVYKCLSNNASANSTVEPRGDYTSSNGNIATSDGYIWKYMFNVKPSNRFLTDEWIPVPSSINQLDYGSSELDVIDGELTTIVVTNKGTGYFEKNIRIIDTFVAGCSTLTLANTDFVAANMYISGAGITVGSYITSVGIVGGQPQLTLSTPTSSSGGGDTAANSAQLTTRIYIDGDGTSTVASATLNTVGNVDKITVTTIGTGYSKANVFIYGTGSNAAARAVMDMKYGHALNPAKELVCNSVMICVRMGEIDSTENGKIPANTTFRQYGVLVNPHKYGESSVVSPTNANSVIAQTRTLTLVPGGTYSLDEYVYQGESSNTAYAYGFVLSQVSDQIKITNVKGDFVTGVPVVGANSSVSRLLVSSSNPEFEPYSGDILYAENDVKTTRADGQAENIRLIVRF